MTRHTPPAGLPPERPDLPQLVAAMRAGDLERVRTMLDARPDLVHMDMASNNEHGALHDAVLDPRPGWCGC